MKNSFAKLVVVIIICCISTLTYAQSWSTSGDTISSSGYVKATHLNVTGSVLMKGLVSDTTADLLGISKQGNVFSLNGVNMINVLYPTAPVALTCGLTTPQWYKQPITGENSLVTKYCVWVGAGEAGLSGLPDAPLSVSSSNSTVQFSVVNPVMASPDVFTIDNMGNTYTVGKVVIGDSMTTPGNYGLYIRKGILTSIVKIALPGSGSWSDYVFGNNYKLKSLPEVEDYIKENKHLPDVPSADSVQKNGIDVGEMDAVMMKKIEELTLYIIQQNKKIEELQKQVDALSKQVHG